MELVGPERAHTTGGENTDYRNLRVNTTQAGAKGAASLNVATLPQAVSEREDAANAALVYRGQARPGAPEDAAEWRISRTTISGTSTKVEWATVPATAGLGARAGSFDNPWTERATLTYT